MTREQTGGNYMVLLRHKLGGELEEVEGEVDGDYSALDAWYWCLNFDDPSNGIGELRTWQWCC
jgi:hypothetical protein